MSKPNPAVSVLLPNYNDAATLPAAVDTIASVGAEYIGEFIICDDGSTDNSIEVLNGLQKKYAFLKVIRTERNMGVMPTLDRLLSCAAGDYVVMPAADDFWIPEHMRELMAEIPKYPEAAIFCGGQKNLLVPGDLVLQDEASLPETGLYQDALLYANRRRPWGHAGVIYRTDAIRKYWKTTYALGPYHDMFLHFILASRYPVYYLKKPLSCFRIDGGSVSSVNQRRSFQRRIFPLIFELLESMPDVYEKLLRSKVLPSCFGIHEYILAHPRSWSAARMQILRQSLFDRHFYVMYCPSKLLEVYRKLRYRKQ